MAASEHGKHLLQTGNQLPYDAETDQEYHHGAHNDAQPGGMRVILHILRDRRTRGQHADEQRRYHHDQQFLHGLHLKIAAVIITSRRNK